MNKARMPSKPTGKNHLYLFLEKIEFGMKFACFNLGNE